MRRREFITLLGGAAAWPLAADAQQPRGLRRIGVLMNVATDDLESQTRIAAFLQGLQQLGWTDGGNVRIEIRWGAGDVERIRIHAAELVALTPDVILAAGTPVTAALQQATGSVPIVFVQVIDPVAAGFVDSLARPGGNTTGFTVWAYDDRHLVSRKGLHRAQMAGMTDHSLRAALKRPHVMAHYLAECEVLRLSGRAKRLWRLEEIAASDRNLNASVNAIKCAEQLEDSAAPDRGGMGTVPGLVVTIVNAPLPKAPTIDVSPSPAHVDATDD
jgi:hypothetical protein